MSDGKLTVRHWLALRAARDKGGAYLATVNKTGGAWRRMCVRMAEMGLLDAAPPFALTEAGRIALETRDAQINAAQRRAATSRPFIREPRG